MSPRAPLSPALLESRKALSLSCHAATQAGILHIAYKTAKWPSSAMMAKTTRDIFRRQALEFLADSLEWVDA